MSQFDSDEFVDTISGSTLVTQLNSSFAAHQTNHAGASRPSYAVANMIWVDTDSPSATLNTVYFFDGTDDIEIGIVDKTNNRFYKSISMAGDGAVGAPGMAFVDDLDNGLYRIGTNNWAAAVAGAKALEFDASGAILKALQPSFLAYNSASDSNVTGNGATATVDFDTEVFDRGGDFAADTFTAPVTGLYQLNANIRFTDLVSAGGCIFSIVTSNRTYQLDFTVPVDGTDSRSLSVLADMDAADTATVTLLVSGMAGDTVDIVGGTALVTSFSGHLAA